jgi:protoporphyrinogen oxidase
VVEEVCVIGAGPAGLTAAYLLTKEGVPINVIEQDERYVCGISRTENYKGFLFDIGGHRFFSKSKEVVALWNEILPDDFIERPRLSRIYYDGKFFALDPTPECAAAAEALRYRDFLTVALVLNRPDPFSDNWIYVHEPSVDNSG